MNSSDSLSWIAAFIAGSASFTDAGEVAGISRPTVGKAIARPSGCPGQGR